MLSGLLPFVPCKSCGLIQMKNFSEFHGTGCIFLYQIVDTENYEIHKIIGRLRYLLPRKHF
jgi:hypothetical protein